MSESADDSSVVGRYTICDAIASGGMATVYLGRLRGPAGFSRTVAIKRLHPEFAESPDLVAALLDEARLISRVQHPNVVAPLDVVAETGRLLLVMEYIHGASLSQLMRPPESKRQPLPPAIAAAILIGTLRGLHAAHEAKGEGGELLGIVHRDVSPQNILVGVDGLARVADFGVAKARGRLQTTREGQIKGKLAYMTPEQIRRGEVSPRSDVFAAGIVLWEAVTGRRLFRGDNEGQVLSNVLSAEIEPPSALRPELPEGFDELARRALDRDPEQRYDTAKDFADAIEQRVEVASSSTVGEWVKGRATAALALRAQQLSDIEQGSSGQGPSSHAEEPTRTATVERPTAESPSGTTATAYESPTSTASPRSAGGRGRSRAALAVALLAAGGIIVTLALGQRDGSPAAQGVDGSSTESSPAVGAQAPADQSAAQPPSQAAVTIEVLTTPRGAMVQIGGETHGPTPTEFELERSEDTIEMTVRLAGHLPVERSVTPDKDQRLELVLHRIPRGSRPAGKTTAPSAKTTAEPGKDFWRFE